MKPLVAVAPNADMAALGALAPNAFEGAAAVLPPELVAGAALPPDETAARRYSTIASWSPDDSTVALPLATCRHCFSSGQMALCEMP